MITIHLDPSREDRLRQLAASQGQDESQLAQRILEDFLDAKAWPEDASGDWADASVALTPEILPEEDWEEGNIPDGAR